MAGALIAAALFSAAPALLEIGDYVQYRSSLGAPGINRWALIAIFLALLQVAYGVFLLQLPDWTSLLVVALYLLAVAAAYALVLGVTLVSGPSGWLVGQGGLQLADKLAGGKAALWCLCMTSVSMILAFFAGRQSVQWRNAERIRKGVRR
jgi:hypothetical protein